MRSSLASEGSAPSQGHTVGDAVGVSRPVGKWSPYFIPAEDRSALFPRSPFLSTDLRVRPPLPGTPLPRRRVHSL